MDREQVDVYLYFISDIVTSSERIYGTLTKMQAKPAYLYRSITYLNPGELICWSRIVIRDGENVLHDNLIGE